MGLAPWDHPCYSTVREQPTHPVRPFLLSAGRAGAVSLTSGATSCQTLAKAVGPTTQTHGCCPATGNCAKQQCPGTTMTQSAW